MAHQCHSRLQRRYETWKLIKWVCGVVAALLLVYVIHEGVPEQSGMFVSLFLGGFITWGVSWYYYRRASQELTAEAARLRELTELILFSMERMGWVELNRDSTGRITGFRPLVITPPPASVVLTTAGPTVKIRTPEHGQAKPTGTASCEQGVENRRRLRRDSHAAPIPPETTEAAAMR